MLPYGTNRTSPNYGRGTHTIEDDEFDAALNEAEALKEWLPTFLSKPNVELPKPPSAALEIAEMSRQPNATIEALSALISREPLLAAKVLRVANSALYGAAMPCTALNQALVRVGLSKVRDVVLEAAFSMTVIHAPGFEKSLERIRAHSTAVAWLSRAVARRTPMEAENAFLIGLLHDLGFSVGLSGLCQFLKAQGETPKLTPERWMVVDQLHESFSQKVLSSWGLPPQLTLIVGQHHSLRIGGHHHPSTAILYVAEHLAVARGWGVCAADTKWAPMGGVEATNPDTYEEALAVLRIDPAQHRQLAAEAEKLLAGLSGQFDRR